MHACIAYTLRQPQICTGVPWYMVTWYIHHCLIATCDYLLLYIHPPLCSRVSVWASDGGFLPDHRPSTTPTTPRRRFFFFFILFSDLDRNLRAGLDRRLFGGALCRNPSVTPAVNSLDRLLIGRSLEPTNQPCMHNYTSDTR